MKFTVSSKKLYQKLQAAAQVINKKNTLPILDCFLLGLRGNILNIAGSDSEIRLVTKIEVEDAQGDIKIAVNAKTLVDSLKELPEQPITFEVNESTFEVLIHYHNGKFNFIGQSADDYPTPKNLDEKVKQVLVIGADVLQKGIGGTLFSVANDELRPVMNGVYFDIAPENIAFVASDGHKLVRLISPDATCSARSSFILPTKASNVIRKLAEKQSETVKIRFDFNQAVFDFIDYVVSVRFIEGRYPNYQSVIPQGNTNRFSIDKGTLTSIIKRVSVFSNQASNMVKFDLSSNALTVSAQDIDFSTSAEESYELDYVGTPMQIGFKAEFLLELLTNMQASEIEIQLSDPSRAALIVPVKNEYGWDNLSLLMPLKLND